MSSIRILKKDINYLTDEIVQNSLLINALYAGNEDATKEIIETALEDRKSLMEKARIKKQTKADYKAIREDLIKRTDKAFEKLAALTQE